MDKNAIKKYAVWARNELIARVSQKAQQYGITAEGYGDKNSDSVNGVLLSATEKKQRQALIAKIDAEGFEQVMEEVAYTWFNRFTALRFMEVNNYLPSHTRVFTNEANEFKPQILADAISLEIEGLDMNKVFELKDANKDEELYKYLLIVQCNALSSVLPGLFQKISDYTELLLPDYLLRVGSAIEQMISIIPEDNWTDQVQIIGWLYQYYNIEPKEKAFNKKGTEKIERHEIPAATQLFTPEWIVHYLVENSLGRLWLDGHNNAKLEENWKYFWKECAQETSVEKVLADIKEKHSLITPDEIKCLDPCVGSGHIVTVLFDVLMQIYEEYGYSVREAVESIVKNNLWGLDIDERAAQLAYFSVMMKARQYDRRFFSKKLQPNIFVIKSCDFVDDTTIDYFSNGDNALKRDLQILIKELSEAKDLGSLITISDVHFGQMLGRIEEIRAEEVQTIFSMNCLEYVEPLIKVAFALNQKYHVTVTNPPYLNISKVNDRLSNFVKKEYPNSKTDLFAVFIERCKAFCKKDGYQAMITQHAWMYLSSFEKLRQEILRKQLVTLAHLGAHAFEEIGGEVVQTTAFVMRHTANKAFRSNVIRLVEAPSEIEKRDSYLKKEDIYYPVCEGFEKIEGSPLAYRATEKVIEAFESSVALNVVANPRQGLISGDVNRFVRKWYECDFDTVSFSNDRHKKWFPYNNGGECRRWYGNNEDVVNWEKDGFEIQNFRDDKGKQRSRPQNQQFYFKEGGTWTAISSGNFSVRYFPEGYLFSNAGMAIFAESSKLKYLIGFLNSKLSQMYLHLFNEGLNYNQGDIAKLPIIFNSEYEQEIIRIVDECIQIEKEDWDSFEISCDFKKHPLIRKCRYINDAFEEWEKECNSRIESLQKLEEELNRIFIDIYGLETELTPSVKTEDITLRSADMQREIKGLISYAVGCMFGRYSLDYEGLAYAGGKWNSDRYISFAPDEDNVIPITSDEYFPDDILMRFINFIETVYGIDTLEENLKFIAKVLGGNGSARDVIRNYFKNVFYADHLKTYQKRPIYWLFDSGKKGGFKALIYMHRYKSDTIARIRTDYVHEQQSRYRTEISDLEQRIDRVSTGEALKLKKMLSNICEQYDELKSYEEYIHHFADQMIEIDMDAGVKSNYAIFEDVLAKLK